MQLAEARHGYCFTSIVSIDGINFVFSFPVNLCFLTMHRQMRTAFCVILVFLSVIFPKEKAFNNGYSCIVVLRTVCLYEVPELQIRMGFDDNVGIVYLVLNKTFCISH